MDINTILNNLNFDNSRFDEINSANIEHMDISSLFKLENNIIDNINKLKLSKKDLDLLYLNYGSIKNKLNSKIDNNKNLLVNINIQKEEYERNDCKRNLLYLNKEYTLLLEQTNTKKLLNVIKNLEQKIDILKKDIKDKKLIQKHSKIRDSFNNITIFVNTEKFDNKTDAIPNNLSNEEKIIWYENRIGELIEKQMIFDKYIFMLENLYNDLLEKRMLDTTFSK